MTNVTHLFPDQKSGELQIIMISRMVKNTDRVDKESWTRRVQRGIW